jgi:cytochrome c-type biogenesis protein CcmH
MSTSPLKRTSSWLVMAVLTVALLVAGATRSNGPATQADRARAIGQTVKCPVCGGETVADSKVSVAVAIREQIARELAGGKTDDEVRAAVERQYPDTQLTPPATGVTSLVWIMPVVVFVLGLAGLANAFRRWRAEDEDDPEPAPPRR